MNVRCAVLAVLCLCAALCAGRADAGARISTPAAGAPVAGVPLPRVLLDAPVNATWAANHTEIWRERGFSGFLLRGVMDTLSDPPSGGIPFPPTALPREWVPMAAELGPACRRLADAGVADNFLLVRLAPEAPWFTGKSAGDTAVARFELAGKVCRGSGLRGLALDTTAAPLVFDPRWDGHPQDLLDGELEAGARRFALRAVRAFIRAFPKGEILIITVDALDAPPLFLPFYEGALEATGVAGEIPVRLLCRETARFTDAPALDGYAARLEKMAAARLTPENRTRWRRQGGLVAALEPVVMEGPLPSARTGLPQFRLLRDMALLRSSGYVCVCAPRGGWWPVPLDDVPQYGHLRQGGEGAVRFMPPVPVTLKDYVFPGPLAKYRRLGTLPFQGHDAEILLGARGAALLSWRGLRTPLRLTARASLVKSVALETDETAHHAPKRGVIRVPAAKGPVLVDGLPLRSYALPAAMFLSVDPAPEEGPLRAALACGVTNPLAFPLRGRLEVLPPGACAIGSGTAPLKIKAGETLTLARTLQGVVRAGAPLRFAMTVTAPDFPAVVRRFGLEAAPKRLWEAAVPGRPAGPPAMMLVNGENGPEARFIHAGAWGDLTALDLEGGELWRRRLGGRWTLGPAVALTPAGPVAAVADHRGRLLFCDGDGGVRGETLLGAPLAAEGLVAHRFSENDAEVFVVLSETGVLARVSQVGAVVWRRETGLARPVLGAVPPELGWGGVWVAGTDAGGLHFAVLYDDTGAEQRREALDAAPTAPPVPAVAARPGVSSGWLLGLENGTITDLTGDSAGRRGRIDAPVGAVLRVLPDLVRPGDPKPCLIAVGAAGAVGVGADGKTRWAVPLPGAVRAAALPDRTAVIIGADDGTVLCLESGGAVRWRDTRAWGAAGGLALFAAPGDRTLLLAATADGFLRALDAGRLRPEPGVRVSD